MKQGESLMVLLRHARETGVLIDFVPPELRPRSVDEAYAIAAQVTRDRGAIAGWKVGATSARGQELLGLSDCFFGRIFEDSLLRAAAGSAGVVECARGDSRALEPEIAFVLGDDLPPRRTPYSVADVVHAIRAIAPALELNRPSYAKPFEVGGLALIADNGVNVGAVLGQSHTDWKSLEIANITVAVAKSGQPIAKGHSSAVLGNPLSTLAWLANTLPRYGEQLRKQQIVLSGAMTPPIDAIAGDAIAATFSQLGTVSVRLQG